MPIFAMINLIFIEVSYPRKSRYIGLLTRYLFLGFVMKTLKTGSTWPFGKTIRAQALIELV